MRKMRRNKSIYIAGKISDLPYDEVVMAFYSAEVDLCSQGTTINPVRICDRTWSWLRCMIVCVFNLLTKCDRIYLLPNWHDSRGAKIELWFAILTKKEILS